MQTAPLRRARRLVTRHFFTLRCDTSATVIWGDEARFYDV